MGGTVISIKNMLVEPIKLTLNKARELSEQGFGPASIKPRLVAATAYVMVLKRLSQETDEE